MLGKYCIHFICRELDVAIIIWSNHHIAVGHTAVHNQPYCSFNANIHWCNHSMSIFVKNNFLGAKFAFWRFFMQSQGYHQCTEFAYIEELDYIFMPTYHKKGNPFQYIGLQILISKLSCNSWDFLQINEHRLWKKSRVHHYTKQWSLKCRHHKAKNIQLQKNNYHVSYKLLHVRFDLFKR